MQKSLYFGWNTFDVWSLTSTLSLTCNCTWFVVFFSFLFPSLAFLASLRLCATTRYNFDITSMLIMLSSVPKYFGHSDASSVCFIVASRLNIRKNGAVP